MTIPFNQAVTKMAHGLQEQQEAEAVLQEVQSQKPEGAKPKAWKLRQRWFCIRLRQDLKAEMGS